ncbi:NifB/NifX family molybdenum-iron cluster-binding protein [candidate division KSB1 bacterium]|nr:NifB/NifX family molybdenum-iron cluster-binding protein [candidate division KSB1 bacterium]
MALALAVYENRIASLFESSNRFIFFDQTPYTLAQSYSVNIPNQSPTELIKLLKANNCRTLICGAISGSTFIMVQNEGIEVIPWITGELENVIAAYQNGNGFSPHLIMPGCRKGFHRRQHRFRCGSGKWRGMNK